MKDDQLNRLDDRTAERLLRGDPETTGAGELRLLSALLEAAAASPVREARTAPTADEDAAAAAFRIGLERAPRRRRPWLRRPVKAGAGVLAAVMLFGGVAVAVQAGAIRLPLPGRRGPAPSTAQDPASAPAGSSASASSGLPPDGTGYSGTPAAGQQAGSPFPSGAAGQGSGPSLRSLCTDYQSAQQDHGTLHSAAALRRLTEAAGSEGAIAGYCTRLLGSSGGAARGGSTSNGSGGEKTPTAAASPSKGPK